MKQKKVVSFNNTMGRGSLNNFFSPNLFVAFFFLAFYYFCSSPVFAQDNIRISGVFEGNTRYATVLMKKFGIGSQDIAVAAIQKDSFFITVPPTVEPGVYRFQYAHTENVKYVDIIINGTDKVIEFRTKANDPAPTFIFTGSQENETYQNYLKKTDSQLEKVEHLNRFINQYPDRQAPVIKAVIKEYEAEKQQYYLTLNDFKNKMQGTWAYFMVANRPYYFTNPTDDFRIQDYTKREHFWDNFDATNPKLINSPLFTEHILNYLSYWMNPNMGFGTEEKTNGFKNSVDLIMSKFSTNKETQEFAYRYLSLGFKEIGEEEILKYIDQKYKDLANQCMDTVEKSAFDNRMKGYDTLKQGKVAPNILFTDSDNKKSELYNFKADQTLLVFWASWCPHCTEELPKVNEWAKNNPEVKVLAISLDDDKNAYENAIKNLPNILHHSDFKRWEGQAAKDYFIVGTPTFILLDQNKKILGKYGSFKQLNTLK